LSTLCRYGAMVARHPQG